MEYLSFDLSKKKLELKSCAIPKPGPEEIRMRVSYAGICGTDLHILEGSFPCKNDGPLILGHEFSGIVEEIGQQVTTIKVGQRVVVDPNSGCNKCNFCHSGSYHFCSHGGINSTIGIYRDGGWATHAVVPETQVYLVPEDIPMDKAALTEPLSCLAHGWDKINPVHVGSRVLVIGAGIIGLLWTCLLHLHGHRKTVTVSEPQDKRRSIVKDLELDYDVKHPSELKNNKFDLAVDCSGSGPAMETAVPLLDRGGRLCVFGVASPTAKLTVEPFQIYMKEIEIIGVNINPHTFPKGISLLQAMSSHYLNFNNLRIKVYQLSQYEEALTALREGDISKAIFKIRP
ncbi:uncharacterized protein [Prorops nasuta]|uniref:uncharacterized protein n=1 Tax=Prorops nasuta TaxID=863751 RepID=UPI0034CFC5DD